jgi:hypothetical protein
MLLILRLCLKNSWTFTVDIKCGNSIPKNISYNAVAILHQVLAIVTNRVTGMMTRTRKVVRY